MNRSLSGFHYEQVLAEDKPLPIPKLQAEEIFITLQGGEIRYVYTPGTEPTALFGHLLYDGMSLRLTSVGQIENFKFIKASERPSVLSITYEKE